MSLVIQTSLAQREAELATAPMRADRRLYLTVDKSRIVEEGDPAAAWLFAGVGQPILPAEIARYRLGERDGRVVILDAFVPPAEARAAVPVAPATTESTEDGTGPETPPEDVP